MANAVTWSTFHTQEQNNSCHSFLHHCDHHRACQFRLQVWADNIIICYHHEIGQAPGQESICQHHQTYDDPHKKTSQSPRASLSSSESLHPCQLMSLIFAPSSPKAFLGFPQQGHIAFK